ncbi:extracellular solute-binding protein [Pseudovibrio exalbescens]|uniref:extracellular solute-binding protein n=1 Tax=Pseudovibrio exalbescens TaxID=197461 RepID=UPI002366908C|nr:extracellular solute-binding protein [Pseudovibrio exalbescens]MDD7908343.1 extracellular solute-binding protein [Pseudovibrio exalbescens]
MARVPLSKQWILSLPSCALARILHGFGMLNCFQRHVVLSRALLVVCCALLAGYGAPTLAQTDDKPLRIVTRNGPSLEGPAIRHGEVFERDTGMATQVEGIPFRELYNEIMMGFISGVNEADVMLVPAPWVPDFAPFLADVPMDLIASNAVRSIHPAYREGLMRWNRRWLAVTIDGDLHMGIYRRDLFEDPEHRLAFQGVHGRPLSPPETWTEYLEIARFFHGRKDQQGNTLAGSLEAYLQGGQRIWFVISHAAAYASHPSYSGTLFFNPRTMEPAINSPAWQRAVSEYAELMSLGPPDLAWLGSGDVRKRFSEGKAAMAVDWADIGVMAATLEGGVGSENIGFFELPGSTSAWNPITERWDTLAYPRQVPYLAFGGWVAVVPETSQNKEAAWDYISHFNSQENSMKDMLVGDSGINPYRREHIADETVWFDLMGEQAAEDYLDVLRSSLDAPQLALELRIPGYRAYMQALDLQIERVLRSEATVQEALDLAAAQWDQITDRLGRDSQRRHYISAMGLTGSFP